MPSVAAALGWDLPALNTYQMIAAETLVHCMVSGRSLVAWLSAYVPARWSTLRSHVHLIMDTLVRGLTPDLVRYMRSPEFGFPPFASDPQVYRWVFSALLLHRELSDRESGQLLDALLPPPDGVTPGDEWLCDVLHTAVSNDRAPFVRALARRWPGLSIGLRPAMSAAVRLRLHRPELLRTLLFDVGFVDPTLFEAPLRTEYAWAVACAPDDILVALHERCGLTASHLVRPLDAEHLVRWLATPDKMARVFRALHAERQRVVVTQRACELRWQCLRPETLATLADVDGCTLDDLHRFAFLFDSFWTWSAHRSRVAMARVLRNHYGVDDLGALRRQYRLR
jgi:hypothetical protein